MSSDLDRQIIASQFDSNWVPHTSILVKLSNDMQVL